MTTIPTDYFNATAYLAPIKHYTKLSIKVSQFTDNLSVTNNHSIYTKEGRGGYTLLHKDLYEEYHRWLQNIGETK